MSNFVVSARKYRPIRFDEVVGQEHVSQTLKNALQNDHLAHAFLFCGPRGVGKTTCARILAKVLNCQNRTEDFEACNTCSSCEAFNNNASFNITELDAASNNSVEHIRALIEQVRFQPQQGDYKVFIIDEVHMLSQQAFNAFLKTLEEPPSYAIFILATTEKHKIIPTILSRCQIFDFRRIQINDIVQHLEEICAKEEIKADKDALHIIAQKADGALRDALSIFDRIVSFSGKSIQYDDVIQNLNVLDYDYYFQLVDGLLASDVSKTLLLFNDILKKGFEPDIFINGLAGHLRNLLVCQDEKTIQLMEVSQNLAQRYKTQAQLAPSSFILTALNLANDCDVNYKMARNKRLHVEMTLIKMAHIAQAVELATQPPIAIEEKKTPDLNTSTNSPIPKEQSAENSSPTPPTSIVEEPKVTPTPPSAAEQAPPVPTQSEEKANSLSKRLQNKSKKISPTLSLSQLQEELAQEEQADQKKEQTELTIEHVKAAWEVFTTTISSNTVRMTMKQAELQLEGREIKVIIGSKRSEGHIREEYDLMPFLRKELGHKDLMLTYQIDPSKSINQDTEIKKPAFLTPKEKFEQMKEQNPKIVDLYQQFDLKLDNDF